MSRRSLNASKALLVLTAAGLLLSGCYYYAPYGAPHFGPRGYGHAPKYHGEGKRGGYGHGSHYHNHY